MEEITVTTREGEHLTLHKESNHLWYCPVCGSLELRCPPRTDEGASFEMCSCGFEFGFDDDPSASAQAVEGINENWSRWRGMLLRKHTHQPEKLNQLKSQLAKIGCEVQF